jgi:hypothetical protein
MQQNYFLKAKKFAIFTEYEGPFSCSQDAATGLDFKNQVTWERVQITKFIIIIVIIIITSSEV